MKKIHAKHVIFFLIGALMVFALAYTLETNQINESQALLKEQRALAKELGLGHQESLERLSLIHLGKDLIEVQQELQLEQVKSFTLLHPKPSQLSLNEQSYEL